MTFAPTVTTHMQPSTCRCCGFQATGIGIGNPTKGDPGFLCTECLLLLEKIKATRRMTPYELKARHGGVDAAGPLVEQFGSDLAEWTEEQVLEFVGVVWRGCADRLHKVLEDGDAPF